MQKIGFCDRYGLTKAVHNGTKTMTRRVIKDVSMKQLLNELEEDNKIYTQNADIEIIKEKVARYKLGEVVAVAQSYKVLGYTKEWVDLHISPNPNAKWNDPFEKIYPGWSNKMFVPAELNKAHKIQITGVRIERLQAISEDDCLKEGVYYDADVDGYKVFNLSLPNKEWGPKFKQTYFQTPREAFAALIARPGVGRKGLWESNPWVVVYTFKLI